MPLFDRNEIEFVQNVERTKKINLSANMAIDTLTFNHDTLNGSVLNMFNQDTALTYEFRTSSTAGGGVTSTLILDFGESLIFHSVVLHYQLQTAGANANNFSQLDLDYSTDKVTWTDWTDETLTGATKSEDHDSTLSNTKLRYIRFQMTGGAGDATSKDVELKALLMALT